MSSDIKSIDPAPSPAGSCALDQGSQNQGSQNLGSLGDTDLLDAWVRDAYRPALGALIERYSVMVLSVCRRRCRSEADAEDAYQTTFLYLARNGRRIRRPECLPGWLQRVAQRASIATLSSSKRETEPMVEPPSEPIDPLDRLTQRHEAIVLDEELADLPEHYRAAIVMHCYEDRPLQALAEHFGTSIGSIRGRLQRGKQLLAQRLRHRGVVPVVAYAAAEASKVSTPQAALAAEQFIESTAAGHDFPSPPIETPLLESLLSQGIRLMPSLYTSLGLVGGSALIAMMMMNDGSRAQPAQPKADSSVVTLPRMAIGEPGAAFAVQAQAAAAQPADAGASSALSADDDMAGAGSGMGGMGMGAMGMDMDDTGMGMGGMGMGGMGMGMAPAVSSTASDSAGMVGYPGAAGPYAQWMLRSVAAKPSGPIARQVMAKLDAPIALDLSTTLAELPQAMGEALGVPVIIDERGVAFAKQDPGKVIEFSGHEPLRTALRRMLSPLGLQAVVEEEGLTITADPATLVHQGIGADRWVSIDEEAAQAIGEKLDAFTAARFVEMPLSDAISNLSQTHQLPMIVDARALEEIGLTVNETVNFDSQKISIRNLLSLLLEPLDLTYTIKGDMLVVTTKEASEQAQISRIYWLEGTGLAGDDLQPVLDTLQSSIVPDTWEALGGPSTISPIRSARPALVINTSYTIHHSIERFFNALRESHFGSEPVLEPVQVPAQRSPMQGGMGAGGMGGGGMF